MNMMTVIPTVMEIEIAKTKPPAIISVIFFSPACVLRPKFSVQFELSHDGRREHITRCSVFLLPREACRHIPRLGGIDRHVQTKRPLGWSACGSARSRRGRVLQRPKPCAKHCWMSTSL